MPSRVLSLAWQVSKRWPWRRALADYMACPNFCRVQCRAVSRNSERDTIYSFVTVLAIHLYTKLISIFYIQHAFQFCDRGRIQLCSSLKSEPVYRHMVQNT